MEIPHAARAKVSSIAIESLRKGDPLYVDELLRDRLCLLDNGTLCIVGSYRGDDQVLEYEDLLRRQRNGIGFTKEFLTPDEIQTLYRAVHQQIVPESESARQRQMLTVLKDAVAEGASDVHIINTAATSKIDFRIDGLFYPYRGRANAEHALTGSDGQELCGALMQGMAHTLGGGHYDKNSSQDSRLRDLVAGQCGLQGARIATRPLKSDNGNFVVIRLLYDRGIQTFEMLGYAPDQVELLKEYAYLRKGIFLMSGPTGGGKTTTLYSMTDAILKDADYRINLMTVEDPIEGKVRGARHTQLDYDPQEGAPAIAQAWRDAIRNVVRLDPDVCFLGEIRDFESAMGAIHMAMTGHGLLTSLHTENATQILDRLGEMGVNRSLLSDPTIMRCLVNQSLAPRNCPHCRVPYLRVARAYPEAVRRRIEKYCGDLATVYLRGRDRNCPHCNGRGVKGRIVVSEILKANESLLSTWASHGAAKMRHAWLAAGGRAKSHLLADVVRMGIVDPILGEKEIGVLLSDDRLE